MSPAVEDQLQTLRDERDESFKVEITQARHSPDPQAKRVAIIRGNHAQSLELTPAEAAVLMKALADEFASA